MTPVSAIDDITDTLLAENYINDNAASFYVLNSYDSFISIIEASINKAIGLMEANPKFLQKLSEDEITNFLSTNLRMAGIPTDHDSMEGGHSDIVIKNLRYKWLAEAKIKDTASYDYAWLWSGFMQLTERYATNTANCNRAGFIVYIKQENSRRVMDRWKAHMVNNSSGYKFDFENSQYPHSFLSSHEHTRFGDACKVTHFSMSAHFAPVV